MPIYEEKNKMNADYQYGKIFGWLIGYSLLFVLASTFLNRLSAGEAILVFIYQIFLYILPGMAIVALVDNRIRTDVEWIGYSFAAGYCFNILLYYIVVPLGLQQYIRIIGCLCALVSMCIIYKKREGFLCVQDRNGWKLCTVGVSVYGLFMFIAYNGNGLTPDLTGATDYFTYHRDVLYWIGNLQSLMKQYPPINPREYTRGIYNYHYFSSLQLAVQSLFTGVNAAVVCIGLYFHATVGMIVFGTYLLAARILKGNKGTAFAMCALLATSGVENITKIEHVCHYALAAFGTDYGLGIMLFLLLMLYRYCEEPLKRHGVICLILLAVLTGTKGPYAAVAICGFGGVCLLWLIQKKLSRAFAFGFSSLGVFGAIYYFVCNTRGYAGGGNSSYKLINLVIRTDPNMSMLEACLRKLGREVVNILLMKPIVLLPFVVILFVLLWHRRRISIFEFGCLCMTAAGLAVNAIITMPSNQQTYFALAALVPAWCFVLGAGQYKDLAVWKRQKNYRYVCAAMKILLVVGAICCLAGYTYNGNKFNAVYSIEDGIRMIAGRVTGQGVKFDQDGYWENGLILEAEEYEALCMMAQDGDPQAVIFHVTPESKERYRTYRKKLIVSFSGKYIMNDEGAADALTRGDKQEYLRLYNMGVRYILVDYQKENDALIQEEYAEEVFEGEQIKLYKLYDMAASEQDY